MDPNNYCSGTKGSQFCIRTWVNREPREFADMILTSSPFIIASSKPEGHIEWLSPLVEDDYKEYRDDFLTPLGLDKYNSDLRSFWPRRGPQWDCLGWIRQNQNDAVLLIEAKAHTSEMSTPSGAKDIESVKLIRESLTRVQRFMGIKPHDWMFSDFYQFANRLAFLYFLNQVVNVPAYLAMVNFVNDVSYKPTSLAEWRQHYIEVFRRMGINQKCRMLDRLIMLFLPASPFE